MKKKLPFIYLLCLFIVSFSSFANISCCRPTIKPRVAQNKIENSPFAFEYRDLMPHSSWKCQGDVIVKDERLYLSKNGQGALTYNCPVDIDQNPYLMLRMGDSLPGPIWRISVAPGAKASTPHYILLETKEEGEWLLPLKREKDWAGAVDMEITLSMEGRKDDWIVFDSFRIVYLANTMEKPSLLAPIKSSEVRNFAVHFVWCQAPNAVDYEIQYSQSADFANATIKEAHPPVYYLADKLWYLPDEEFTEGDWYWRVRGINKKQQPGPWSEPEMFKVSNSFMPRPPERVVSTGSPLMILFSDNSAGMTQNWTSLDSNIKRSTYLRIEALPSEELIKMCETAEQNQIPILIQVSGPHDFYGPTSSRISLSEVENIFRKYRMVKGAFICEQACQFNGINSKYVASYMRRLLRLSAHYGRLVAWADGHWGRYQWLDVTFNDNLLAAIRAYLDNFIPIWKMNCGVTPYSVHGALLGLWLSNSVKNWGAEPENWYWSEAGLHEINQQKWFKEGAPDKMPPAFYGQMMLLGIASGASAYVIEPPNAIWEKPGQFSRTWQDILQPMISLVLEEKVAPDKITVASLVKKAVVFNQRPVWHWNYDKDLCQFYQAAYKPIHIFDILPKTNNYFLPIFTPATKGNIFLADFHASPDPDTTNASLLERKEEINPPSSGTTFTVQHHNISIVTNTNENRESQQKYELPLTGDFKTVSGALDTNGYLIIRQVSSGALKIRIFGRNHQINRINLTFNKTLVKCPIVSFNDGGKGWKNEFTGDMLGIIPESFSGVTEEILISIP